MSLKQTELLPSPLSRKLSLSSVGVTPTSSRNKISVSLTIDEEASVNDARMNYYGTKLAVACSDNTVRVFLIDNKSGGYHKLADLSGYTGQVWSVAWSHPKFNKGLLASASFDGRVIIWKETEVSEKAFEGSQWTSVFDEQLHSASVNAVSWADPKFGAIVAAGSIDGSISILALSSSDNWTKMKIEKAHELGCQTVSWSPFAKRFVSGGNDCNLKVWSWNGEESAEDENAGVWALECQLNGHSDWISSVEYSPVEETFVSAGRDGKVLIWKEVEDPPKPSFNHSSSSLNLSQSYIGNISNTTLSPTPKKWSCFFLQLYRSNHFSVNWDSTGLFIFVNGRDTDEIYLWRQHAGTWICVEKSEDRCIV